MNRDIKRGDIYWITTNPYRPSVGHMMHQNRPAIIVSNDACTTCAPTLQVVFLTTKPKRDLPTHCTIRSSNRVSTAICEQITTISKSEQIGNYIGTCTEQEMEMVDSCLASSLGLDFKMEPERTRSDDSYIVGLEREIERLKASLEQHKRESSERNIAAIQAIAREKLLMQLYKEAIDQ